MYGKGFIHLLTNLTRGSAALGREQRDLGRDHAPQSPGRVQHAVRAGSGRDRTRTAVSPHGQAGAGGVVRMGSGRVVVWRGVRNAVHGDDADGRRPDGQCADRRARGGAAVRADRRDGVAKWSPWRVVRRPRRASRLGGPVAADGVSVAGRGGWGERDHQRDQCGAIGDELAEQRAGLVRQRRQGRRRGDRGRARARYRLRSVWRSPPTGGRSSFSRWRSA